MVAPQRFSPILLLSTVFSLVSGGCHDDADVVREIQAQRHRQIQSQSDQDHLGDAFGLLQRLVELNPEKAERQIAYHLNRWREGRTDENPAAVPKLIATISDVLDAEMVAERVARESFVKSDVSHLREAYLFRQIVQWIDSERSDDPLLDDWLDQQRAELGEENAGRLRTATRLFDWTVRNVAFEPLVRTDMAPPPPPLPLDLKFQGPGYRQSDYQTVLRGTGDSLQRAGIFTLLCRQASIPAFVLSIQSTETGELTPWSVGVLIDEEVYLFEPELGIFVPGPDQVGIATLSQARSDASVMRRLNVPGFFDYPHDKEDVQQCTALLNVIPEALSPRMKHLESGLTGNRRMKVYVDVDGLAKQIDEASGIAGVRLWTVPVLAEIYRMAMERAAERDPMFAFWYISRWAIMDAPIEQSQRLTLARWRHLHGHFDTDEMENVEGARQLYLSQRAPEFEIAKLSIDVNLQKVYGIRRELGTDKAVYEQQVMQAQGMMRMGKRTATYWLSLIQYDDQRYQTAENWLVKRALDEEQRSFWEPAARYNLARTVERLDDPQRAIELYKTSGDPQEHGNRIRARLVAKSFDD